MKFILSIIFLLSFFIDVKGQKNYIIPEPQKITFPESKQNGFRLSKKTSIEVQGIDISKLYVSDFISFVNFDVDHCTNQFLLILTYPPITSSGVAIIL